MRKREIDGLRAVAMTMVIAQHCKLFPLGWMGVWLFYAISGYVITLSFQVDERVESWRVATAGFMKRRAIRILPLYLLYLTVATTLYVLLVEQARLVDLPYLLTMTYNWHMIFRFGAGLGDFPAYGHLWTLSVEEQFYLLFPLLYLLSARHRQRALIALVVAGPLVRFVWSTQLSSHTEFTASRMAFSVYASTICHLDAFLAGGLLASLSTRSPALGPWTRRLWLGAGIVGLLHAAAYVTINRTLGASGLSVFRNVFSGVLYGEYREVFVYLVVNAFAVATLAHVTAGRRGTKLLAHPVMAWVGRVSYGGYLFHILLLWLSSEVLHVRIAVLPVPLRIVGFLAVLTLTTLLASLSFQYFEMPLARWLRPNRGPRAQAVPGSTLRPLELATAADSSRG